MDIKKPIIAKINVSKIDKDKMFVGKKGTYLDLVLIPTPNSEYGHDYMVVQGITKEERDAGQKGNILGNAAETGKKDDAEGRKNDARANATHPDTANTTDGIDEDVPF